MFVLERLVPSTMWETGGEGDDGEIASEAGSDEAMATLVEHEMAELFEEIEATISREVDDVDTAAAAEHAEDPPAVSKADATDDPPPSSAPPSEAEPEQASSGPA